MGRALPQTDGHRPQDTRAHCICTRSLVVPKECLVSLIEIISYLPINLSHTQCGEGGSAYHINTATDKDKHEVKLKVIQETDVVW